MYRDSLFTRLQKYSQAIIFIAASPLLAEGKPPAAVLKAPAQEDLVSVFAGGFHVLSRSKEEENRERAGLYGGARLFARDDGKKNSPLVYRIDARLYFVPGGESKSSGRGLSILEAGENLYLGVRACARLSCSLLLGKEETDDSLGRSLTGDRGPLAGIHFTRRFSRGRVRFTPAYQPARGDERSRRDPWVSPLRFAEVRDEKADREEQNAPWRPFPPGRGPDFGHRLDYHDSLGALYWGFALERRQAGRLRETGERIALDRTGLGLGFRVQKESSEFSGFLFLDRARGFLPVPSRRKTGTSMRRVSGYALRLGLRARAGGLLARLRIFLPEPGLARGGSRPRDEENLGYVLWGENPTDTPLMGEILDMRPAPVLEAKAGGTFRESRDANEYRAHALVSSLLLDWKTGPWTFGAAFASLRPLRVRVRHSGAPWKNLSWNSEGESREYGLRLVYRWKKAEARLEYHRLEGPEKTAELARIILRAKIL